MESDQTGRPNTPRTDRLKGHYQGIEAEMRKVARDTSIEELLTTDNPNLEKVLSCMTVDPTYEEKWPQICEDFLEQRKDELMKYAFGRTATIGPEFDRNHLAVIATDYLSKESPATRQYFVPELEEEGESQDYESMEFKRGDFTHLVDLHDFKRIDMDPFKSLMKVFEANSEDPSSEESIGSVGNACRILQRHIGKDRVSVQAINMLYSIEDSIQTIMKHLSNPSVVALLNESLISKLKNEEKSEEHEEVDQLWDDLTDNRIFALMKITHVLLDKQLDSWTIKGAADCLINLLDKHASILEGELLVRATFFEDKFTDTLMERITEVGVN